MTLVVARTATHAFNNAAWPIIRTAARLGIDAAIADTTALRKGVALHRGHVTSLGLAQIHGLPGVTV